MAGVFFYWFAWMGWTIITFFMKKNKIRTELAIFILFLIFFSSLKVTAADAVEVSFSFFILLLYAYRKFACEMKGQFLYYLFSSNIITLAYAVFLIYSMYDPVVVWGNRTWMTAVLVFLITQMLANSFHHRLIVAVIGISHGNILYELVTSRFVFSADIGSLQYFDLLAAAVCLISLWQLYVKATKAVHAMLQKAIYAKSQVGQRSR